MKVAGLSPQVAELLADLEHPAESTILTVRAAILKADSRIAEGIKWKAPSYHVAGAHFATFNLRDRSRVQLILHLGAKPRPGARVQANVTDPIGLLEWKGADRALVTLSSEAVDRGAQRALTVMVQQWIRQL